MKSLSSYLSEGSCIKNAKLQRLLKANGLEGVQLCKGPGYFYITSDNDEMWNRIYSLPNTDIYVNSFNQMSPEEWVDEIKNLFNNQ